MFGVICKQFNKKKATCQNYQYLKWIGYIANSIGTVPEGSVLGGILFLIYEYIIKNLYNPNLNGNISLASFADDMQLYAM